jgi:UDP-N-acetylmuramyl pentapeptide phosphotransferase/UDP-N-acetylglucosamine-1-phosphate transferase
MTPLIILLSIFYFISYFYNAFARKKNIIDNPNKRSSHTIPTVRGGGFIIPIAWFIYALINPGESVWFTLGLVFISCISFADDISPKPPLLRFIVHVLAFTLLFIDVNAFAQIPVWGIILAYILGIGIINAYNFMDGINGMTGLYSLSLLLPLALFTTSAINYGSPYFYVIPAFLVFGWFNFRKKALSFAGDVGSISAGFIIFYLIFRLFLESTPGSFHWHYIALLAVYGVDSTLTIFYRLYLRENIFSAHRRHLYQQLVNNLKWPHLLVSSFYAFIQTIIASWLFLHEPNLMQVLFLLLCLGISYIIFYYYIQSNFTLSETKNNA